MGTRGGSGATVVGSRLEEEMRAQGMSWAALARRARVSPRRLAPLRRPGANPRFDVVLRLAAALGLRPEELLATRDSHREPLPPRHGRARGRQEPAR